MSTTVTSTQIARLRLHTLGIHPSGDACELATPRDVVAHHLAMQAQDWGASRWAIGSRLPGCVEADVLRAYDDGEIVRSWPMRGTVHAVVAHDLRWMLDLMGVRALSGVRRRWEFLGIDEAMLERAREVALQLLSGGGRCTRAELQAAITDAGIDLAGQRAYHTVWYLAQTGTLVQGPTRDREHELVLLDEWVPTPRTLTRDEALAELGLRYLSSHGPATVEDLAHWTKLTKRDCRAAIDAQRDELIELRCHDTIYFMLREHYERIDSTDPALDARVYALAGFDEHLLGYRSRDDVLDPGHATNVDPGRNGVFRWTIVAGGRVIAIWRRTRRVRSIKVSVEPFAKLSKRSMRGVEAAIEKYGSFVGTPVDVSFSDPSAESR